MNKLVMITKIEFKLFLRNFFSVFFAFAFPVGMLLLFGGIYGNEPVEFFGGHGTIDVTVPSYFCMIIAVTGLMSLPLTVAQYRERKILKRFMATPINPSGILISQVIVNFIITVLGMVVLIVVGKIVFDLHFLGRVLPTIFSFLLITLSMFSLGLLIAGVSPNGKTANAISYLIYFPMLFLSGATMPIEIMPKSIANIAKVLPLTHGVELLKGIWLGGKLSDYLLEIIVLLCIFAVCTTIAVKSFKWE
jgi:ABC-2 type transport system permease protein